MSRPQLTITPKQKELIDCIEKFQEYMLRLNTYFQRHKTNRGKVERLRWKLSDWEEEAGKKL